jgi:serine/threonine protein kinase
MSVSVCVCVCIIGISAGITWKRALGIALDVAQGMSYLHGHKPPILHRDLKSLNILVADNWKAKVHLFSLPSHLIRDCHD